jgi:hypothetical protein
MLLTEFYTLYEGNIESIDTGNCHEEIPTRLFCEGD